MQSNYRELFRTDAKELSQRWERYNTAQGFALEEIPALIEFAETVLEHIGTVAMADYRIPDEFWRVVEAAAAVAAAFEERQARVGNRYSKRHVLHDRILYGIDRLVVEMREAADPSPAPESYRTPLESPDDLRKQGLAERQIATVLNFGTDPEAVIRFREAEKAGTIPTHRVVTPPDPRQRPAKQPKTEDLRGYIERIAHERKESETPSRVALV